MLETKITPNLASEYGAGSINLSKPIIIQCKYCITMYDDTLHEIFTALGKYQEIQDEGFSDGTSYFREEVNVANISSVFGKKSGNIPLNEVHKDISKRVSSAASSRFQEANKALNEICKKHEVEIFYFQEETDRRLFEYNYA
jgi:hypothetical protein